jgi:hypothetical protein
MTPSAHLWQNQGFQVGFALAALAAALGAFGFIAHWRVRAIAPVLLALVAAAVLFQWHPLLVGGLFFLAFVATAYFVSPDRNIPVTPPVSEDDFKRLKGERDGLRVDLEAAQRALSLVPKDLMNEAVHEAAIAGLQSRHDAAHGALMLQAETAKRLHDELRDMTVERDRLASENAEHRSKPRQVGHMTATTAMPLLRGHVERFEMLNHSHLTETEQREIEAERKARTAAEIDWPEDAFRLFYRVWLKLETLGTPSKAQAWSYSIMRRGMRAACAPVGKWSVAASWPKLAYNLLDQMQNEFLQNNRVYNVAFDVACPGPKNDLDVRSFEVRFKDDNGTDVICAMKA